MRMGHKLSKNRKPNRPDVIDAIKNLPTRGIVAQNVHTGMVYLDLEDESVFKTVLKDYGYIYPPSSSGTSILCVPPPEELNLGAHIQIISGREAVDYDLVGEREGKKEIQGLGKTVEFRVVDTFHPLIEVYDGVKSIFMIRVESAELYKIRMDLTGLPPTDLGFFINVGVRIWHVDDNKSRMGEREKRADEYQRQAKEKEELERLAKETREMVEKMKMLDEREKNLDKREMLVAECERLVGECEWMDRKLVQELKKRIIRKV